METLLELQTQVPDMSTLNTLDIYLGALNQQFAFIFWGPNMWGHWNVRWRSSGIFAHAHLGHGVRSSGREDIFEDPMDLTFQAPVARHAESSRPPLRSPSSSAGCFNCGQTGHLRSACWLPRRAHSAQPFSGAFGQHASRSPRTNAEVFRSDGAVRRCFGCGSRAHMI